MSAEPSTTANPTPRLDPAASDTTRYLCAAAYLNRRFARAVLDEVVYDPNRAVAPSHAISLGPIIRHCLAARRFDITRDVAVLIVLLLALAAASLTGVVVIVTMLSFWLLLYGVLLLISGRPRAGVACLVIAVLFGPLLGIGLLADRMYQPSTYGSPDEPLFGFGTTPAPSPSGWPVWLLALVILWGINFGYRLWLHRTVAVELSPEEYDPARSPAVDSSHQERMRYIEEAQRGNLTVYAEDSGTRPFIGFGEVTQQWSLTTPLQPNSGGDTAGSWHADPMLKDSRSEPDPGDPLLLDELYDSIRSGLAALSDPRLPPEQRVPDLSIRDRVFLAGRLPPSSTYLDGERPRARLTNAEIKRLESGLRGRVRHYQTVRMAAWGGELDVTIFLHVTLRGGMLYAEFVATVLPGLYSSYRNIDTYERLDAGTVMRSAGRAIADVIRSPGAIARLVSAVGHTAARALRARGEGERVRRQLRFDYGCRTSVRELGTDFDQPPRFQLYDANERIDIITRRFLQTLITFLADHGFATTDLTGQATTVISNNTRIENRNTFLNSTLNSSPVIAGHSASVGSPPAAAGVTPAASGPTKGFQP